ncbi:MAG: hypothetical protein M3529_14415, partial [Actinomycetota bacterium]|nr:hypothetical protein [Actinomycetota bacterium]
RAEFYRKFGKPVIVTFHHEPGNDEGPAGSGMTAADYARAAARIGRILAGVPTIAYAPIMGDWEFNPRNTAGHPRDYLTDELLDASDFLGIDCYQNRGGESFAPRLGRVLDALDQWGHPDMMVGVGETGATFAPGWPKSPLTWMQECIDWCAANTNRIGVVSYFDSLRNSKTDVRWPLSEDTRKRDRFREWLGSPSTVQPLKEI